MFVCVFVCLCVCVWGQYSTAVEPLHKGNTWDINFGLHRESWALLSAIKRNLFHSIMVVVESCCFSESFCCEVSPDVCFEFCYRLIYFSPDVPFPLSPSPSLTLPPRLGALASLGDEIDPTSTNVEDVRAFRKCVQNFQASAGVVCSCRGGGEGGGGRRAGRKMGGVLCQHTIAKISHQISSFHN